MICFARLPFLNSNAIALEIARYTEAWQPHFNNAHYHGEWTVLPLRTPGGADSAIPDLMGEQAYAETKHMQHFPSVQELNAGYNRYAF